MRACVCAPRYGSIFLSKRNYRGASPIVDPDFATALEDNRGKQDSAGRHGEHKTRQLCRQVQRALNLALAERGSDPGLEQLYVDEVTPAPSCGRLLVHFVTLAGQPLPDVFASLCRDAPRLRAQVARAISRKQAPALSFVPVVRTRGDDV